MKVLIVHAHHEPKSFCSALCRQAVETLNDLGHGVVVSDLYGQHFDPVSDRRNFITVDDPDYLKQQMEERLASDANGFAPELEAEIRKLETCDLLVFVFPIWWFGMPAILKGWVDRAFPMRRIYGDGKLYETGLGKAVKRAMVIMTMGGGPDAYGGYGVNPPLEAILEPIERGVFWFNGFLPLDPFIAWRPVRISQEERIAYLKQLDVRLRGLDDETPRRLPPMADFPGFGVDSKKRFMVMATGDHDEKLLPSLMDRVKALKHEGVVLASFVGSREGEVWRAFVLFRESGREQVQQHLNTLPMASSLEFVITELKT